MSQVLTTQNDFTPDQLKLITDTVVKGATPDELKLFLYRCKSMGLDPLKPGQIHFVKYGTSPGTIVVGIEGFRAKAASTGKLSGIKRGALRNSQGQCIGAWAEVYRSDWTHPAREEVPLSEYNTGKGPWQKMPETMIKKVAEAACLRMAFPDQLGGIYTNEEMDQANRGAVYPDQPDEAMIAIAESHGDQGYRIPFGKFARRALEEIDLKQLRDYVLYLEGSAQKKGQPLQGQVLDFVNRAEEHIAAMENAPLDDPEAVRP